MLKKFCILLTLSLLTIFPTMADSLKDAGIEKMVGTVPEAYNFWLYTPPLKAGETGNEEKPLVIFLHGASLCGNDLNKVRRYGTISAIEKGRDIDAFVIAPQNPGGSWKPEKIMNIVDYMCKEYYVDTNRIYVLGMSLGGYGSIDLAATYPDRIAAAIGMCGGATVKDLSGLASMPLWIIHGTADRAVSVSASDKVANAVKSAQGDGINRLQYDRVPGMDHSRPAKVFYRDEVYDWLFTHSLDQKNRPLTPTMKVNDEFFKNAYKGLNHSKGYRR